MDAEDKEIFDYIIFNLRYIQLLIIEKATLTDSEKRRLLAHLAELRDTAKTWYNSYKTVYLQTHNRITHTARKEARQAYDEERE